MSCILSITLAPLPPDILAPMPVLSSAEGLPCTLASLHPSTLAPMLMMLAPTHLAFGLLAASIAGLLTGTPPTPAAFACAALGALLPDIDTTSSAIGRLLIPWPLPSSGASATAASPIP